MRVDTSYRNIQLTGRSAAGRAGQGEALFTIGGTEGSAGAAAAVPMAPAGGIETLLALQAVDDPALRKKKALRRGTAMLDALEAIRSDLLAGGIAEGRLNQLLALVGQARESVEPGIDRVLDDIELRVLVELAKQGRYPGQPRR